MAMPAFDRQRESADWQQRIREAEWKIYAAVLDAAISAHIPFALGGAFGLFKYTGCWRNTKDLDLIVLPRNRQRMIGALTRAGLKDYYDQTPYDRKWIYRGHADGVIVDVIWAMANHRAQVDRRWMTGPEVTLDGRALKVVPPEAILWDKLYIMQRERCDWPDVMNLLYSQGAALDWEAVLQQLGEDVPLLTGALSIFGWLSPRKAAQFPAWLRDRVNLPKPGGGDPVDVDRKRASWLDTRDWYAQGGADA